MGLRSWCGRAASPSRKADVAQHPAARSAAGVPRPIAALAIFYGCVAASSAATVWKIVTGVSQRPLIWPAAWCVGSAAAIYGLVLLKPWGRVLAVLGLLILTVTAVAVAGLLAMKGHPVAALLATAGASIYVIAIRYLSRPQVKQWFTAQRVIG